MDNKKKGIGIFIVAILVIAVFGAPAVYAVEEDITTLGEIQKAIEESGAKWQAGITSVSNLTFEEKQQLCGLKIERRAKDLDREGGPKVMGTMADPNAMTTEGISQENIPRWTSMPPFASPGEVLASWTAPIPMFGVLDSMARMSGYQTLLNSRITSTRQQARTAAVLTRPGLVLGLRISHGTVTLVHCGR